MDCVASRCIPLGAPRQRSQVSRNAGLPVLFVQMASGYAEPRSQITKFKTDIVRHIHRRSTAPVIGFGYPDGVPNESTGGIDVGQQRQAEDP